uniref:UBX domain-containing protein n=1 Tax=Pycnococcus provasolii TaxID=41880 RepID=A0A7S2AJE3_9CHLO
MDKLKKWWRSGSSAQANFANAGQGHRLGDGTEQAQPAQQQPRAQQAPPTRAPPSASALAAAEAAQARAQQKRGVPDKKTAKSAAAAAAAMATGSANAQPPSSFQGSGRRLGDATSSQAPTTATTAPPTHATQQQQSGAPVNIDPEFLAALPEEIRAEVLAQHGGMPAAAAAAAAAPQPPPVPQAVPQENVGGRNTLQLNAVGARQAAQETLGISYERSGAEIKAQAREERQRREEDQVLMTKAQREALKLKRAGGSSTLRARGGAYRLRVRRPDGAVFEAQFRGEEESLIDVYAWAAEVLGTEAFTLLAPPPARKSLPRDDATPLMKQAWCDKGGTMLNVLLQ